MKILFIDPPGRNKGINTGLGYLSAVLNSKHEVFVLDLNNIKLGFCGDPNSEMSIKELHDNLMQTIEEFDPDLIGISVKTFTADLSSHIFKLVKIHRPKIITIAGGPHITLDGLKFIRLNNIDFGVRGEGEYSMPEFCSVLSENGRFKNIGGLIYWNQKNLVNNSNIHIKDLDAIPFPSYDNFSSVISNGGKIDEYPILTSRGCPFNCSYCSMPMIMGKKWRYHSPFRVIDELHYAKKKYNNNRFTVVDDNFTLDLKRIEQISDLLISEKNHIPWNSQNGIRADRINDNIAKKMFLSGCKYVWIGIESADEYVFNSINKGEKLDDIKNGINHLKKAGIRVGGFFITGLPHSTRETDLKSIDFVKEEKIDGWWFNFVPYSHTKASEWIQTHGKILRATEGALQFGTNNVEPVFETPEYSKESRINTYNEIHVKLKYFDRLVDPSLKSWNKWLNVFKIVKLYGSGAISSFIIFILKYYVKLVLKNIGRYE